MELTDDKRVITLGEIYHALNFHVQKAVADCYDRSKQVWALVEVESVSSKAYDNRFYCNVKDEHGDRALALVPPPIEGLKVGDRIRMLGNPYLFQKGDAGQFAIRFSVIAWEPAGISERVLKREIQSRYLSENSYFNRKRRLPDLGELDCYRIALVTSEGSQAIEDINRILGENPFFETTVYPVKLTNPESIVFGIEQATKGTNDLIVITRGGGAELDTFDDQRILDAILKTPKLTMAAIGHAENYTFADRVCDIQANTPSHGAMLLIDKYKADLARKNDRDNEQRFDEMKLFLETSLQTAINEKKELRKLLNTVTLVSAVMFIAFVFYLMK